MLSWRFLKQTIILVGGLLVTACLVGLGHLWLPLLLVGSVSTFIILGWQENFRRVQQRLAPGLFNRISLRWKKRSLKSQQKGVQAGEQFLITPLDGELVKPKRRSATPKAIREAEQVARHAYDRFFP